MLWHGIERGGGGFKDANPRKAAYVFKEKKQLSSLNFPSVTTWKICLQRFSGKLEISMYVPAFGQTQYLKYQHLYQLKNSTRNAKICTSSNIVLEIPTFLPLQTQYQKYQYLYFSKHSTRNTNICTSSNTVLEISKLYRFFSVKQKPD